MDTVRKLKVNLVTKRCFHFRFSTQAEFEEDIAESLYIDQRHMITHFREIYSRSRVRHSFTLTFRRDQRDSNRYTIRVFYQAEDMGQLLKDFISKETSIKPSEQFIKLCNLKDTFLFRCNCRFIYRREDDEVYFPFPFKIEDEFFDEIRGLRLVKLQEEKILMENYLELIATDIMEHRVGFALEGKFSLDLPQRFIDQAKSISRES